MRIFRNITRVLSGAAWLSLTMAGQTFTTLHNFGSYPYDGTLPRSGVIMGSKGELYGTTSNGGEWNLGTVYELLPPVSPGGAWTEVVLHSFDGQDGQNPNARLLLGPGGALYGVAQFGTGWGTIFELDPPTGGSTHWSYVVIYTFPWAGAVYPIGGLVFGPGGSLYGATYGISGPSYGSVYCLTPTSAPGGPPTAWTLTTVYSFPGGTGGDGPEGPLAVSHNGTLFGATAYGGIAYPWGTAFSVTPPGVSPAGWTEKLLYAFNPGTGSGYGPFGGLVIAPTGVLYGTTGYGGTGLQGGGTGTVFSLSPPPTPGEPMTATVLHSFPSFQGDGALPAGALALGPNGVLYGTTSYAGPGGVGTVFELTPPASPGGSWTETILHSFTGGADGGTPNGLFLGPDGTLYGTTQSDGAWAKGTVFAVTP